jgi:Na+-transporting methylmalonyl-CoA/oxaloacetate decarboxylase gamma subunit
MNAAWIAFISGEEVLFALLGFALVMMTLGVLWLLTWGLGRLPIARAQPAPEPTKVSRAPVPDRDREAARLAAVVSAAVAVTLAEPHRVVRFRRIGGDWSREGRRSIFASHKIR